VVKAVELGELEKLLLVTPPPPPPPPLLLLLLLRAALGTTGANWALG